MADCVMPVSCSDLMGGWEGESEIWSRVNSISKFYYVYTQIFILGYGRCSQLLFRDFILCKSELLLEQSHEKPTLDHTQEHFSSPPNEPFLLWHTVHDISVYDEQAHISMEITLPNEEKIIVESLSKWNHRWLLLVVHKNSILACDNMGHLRTSQHCHFARKIKFSVQSNFNKYNY